MKDRVAMQRIARPLVVAALLLTPIAAPAAEIPAVVKAIEDYLDFSEYTSSVIAPEQLPAEDWPKFTVMDARDADLFAREHIPGAIHIDWRRAIARRAEIPKVKMVLLYCDTGSLSAQAVFALRLLGWDNVRVLRGGIEDWKLKVGFAANARASQ